jgi:hypothetical protein
MELIKLQKQILLLEKANQSLEKVFNENKVLNDLEKDGVIQRFEYNVETTSE